ncbi:MAG: hypothetical protein EAZ61_05285 [Oscillatoriales cyanobacterium]|nr:MAG: hypothetical protein EAZ61_05285 [Oscillatoriales cyanobacterium]
MPRFYTVDVVLITSSIPRSHFAETAIEAVADQILAAGGLLKPLLLEETGLEQYAVLDGHFEFYAAVRAHEKDRRAGEMVNAIVILPREKDRALAQLDSLTHTVSDGAPIPSGDEPSSSSSSSQPEPTQLDNLDRRLEAIAAQLREQRTDLNAYVADLQRANREALATKYPSLLAEINALNGKPLEKKLRAYNFKSAVIPHLLAARRKTGGFADYKDLEQRVTGLGAAGILSAIAKWEDLNRPEDTV